MDRITFPEYFFFGAAASGPQTEGAQDRKGRHIMDLWFEKEPEVFFNQVGPDKTSDFYNRYKEDIALMKELNMDSYRTSIVWARLIPDSTGDPDQDAVAFYNNVINEMLRQGVTPYMNLFHFDMPVNMQEIGGWESREVVDAYVHYAKTCFRLFGDRVKTWFTFNEPIVPAEAGYLEGFHYPRIKDLGRAITVAYNTVVAHAKVVEAYRAMTQDGEIGVILNLSPVYPRSQSEEDLKAAEIADLFINKSFIDPVIRGEFPPKLVELIEQEGMLPEVREGDLDIIRKSKVDILGVNYYQPRRVKAPAHPESEGFHRFFDPYEMPGRKMNPYRGWEIYEKGVYDLLIDLKDNYGNPKCFVSENGMGVENEARFLVNGQIHDEYRIEFIKDHLRWIHKAIEEGSNCRGYHLWAFMDCWSWNNAYKNRYGYVSIDLDTQKRTVKKSGEWIREVARDKYFTEE